MTWKTLKRGPFRQRDEKSITISSIRIPPKTGIDTLGNEEALKSIHLSEIELRETYVETLGRKRYEAMSKLLSGSFPPIIVFGKRFEEDNYKIYDGHHRVLAAKKRGDEEILAYVLEWERGQLLASNIETIRQYFQKKGIDPEKIFQAHDFEQSKLIEETVEAILQNDESKTLFFSILKMVVDSYTDLLPDEEANNYKQIVSLYLVIGETLARDAPEVDIEDVKRKMRAL